jgi:acyl-coenzyme A thioesterase PaaI-like protein
MQRANMQIAIQDLYPESHSHCFGCGRSNQDGWHLKSYVEGNLTLARVTPDAKYTGGVPDHLYGGAVASLLDCHGTASAAAFSYLQSYSELTESSQIQRHITAQLNVKYIAPTPMGVELTIRGELIAIEGRKVKVKLSLLAGEQLYSEAEMLAVGLP